MLDVSHAFGQLQEALTPAGQGIEQYIYLLGTCTNLMMLQTNVSEYEEELNLSSFREK